MRANFGAVESQVVRSVQLPKLGSTKRGASMQFL